METLKIKATKTARYARSQPHLPQHFCIEGFEYELEKDLALRIVELNGGDLVEMEVETPEDTEEFETTVEAVEETKEDETAKPKRRVTRRNK